MSDLFHDKYVESTQLPPFDKALHTRKLCWIGLTMSYVTSLVLIIAGVVVFYLSGHRKKPTNQWYPWPRHPVVGNWEMPTAGKECTVLIFNGIVTALTECLGYIHSTSLRWALYHEDRLYHNSNLRLFTNSHRSWPNAWFANAVWAVLMTASYSAASQILISTGTLAIGINGLAMMLLGFCLLGLSLLATSCIQDPNIASWNSNCLNTTLALLRLKENRFVRIVYASTLPLHRQPSPYRKNRSIFYIPLSLWLLVLVIASGGAAVTVLGGQMDIFSDSEGSGFFWLLPPNSYTNTMREFFGKNDAGDFVIDSVANIFFVAGIQALYTLALHTAEQLANLVRDETAWRQAANLSTGTDIGKSPTRAAFTAWPTIFLLILKPVSHWMFGLSVVVNEYQAIIFHALPLFILAGLTLLLAVFATYLTFWKPRGPQPATYGDLRSLAELTDDWRDGDGSQIYWGDKTCDNGMAFERVAGTSANADNLIEIIMDGRPYKGV